MGGSRHIGFSALHVSLIVDLVPTPSLTEEQGLPFRGMPKDMARDVIAHILKVMFKTPIKDRC